MTPQTLCNQEAEAATLCAVLINKDYALPRALAVLSSGDFYHTRNAVLFDAFSDGAPTDLVSLKQFLTDRGQLEKAGGEEYLKRLVFAAVTSAGVEHHARIVKCMALRRQVANLGHQMVDQAHDLTVEADELLSSAKTGIRFIEKEETLPTNRHWSNKALYGQVWEDLWNGQKESGLTLGIESLDGRHYLEKGCTHVVAAESGTGKSAFCLQVADHVARKYGPVLYFSLESTREKLAFRQIARRGKIALTRLHKRHLDRVDDEERISNAISDLIQEPLVLIDDTRYQEVEKLASFAETFAMGQRVRLIVVDYLQLMMCRQNYQNRHLEISHIAKRLNFLAKGLDVPLIHVSQLGKDVEKRTNRRPTLGDLKESGDIRNHADNILFLYAPDSSPVEYQVECFLGKGKDQEQFSTWLEFNGHHQEFTAGHKPTAILKGKDRLG